MKPKHFILWCIIFVSFLWIAALLAGCSSVVKVPVSAPCTEVKREPLPITPLKTINDNSTIAQVMQAYVDEAKVNRAYQNYRGQ